MCSHYEGANELARLRAKFGGKYPDEVFPVKNDIWPGYESLFIRRPREKDEAPDDEAVPDQELMVGRFGMIPHWAKDEKIGRQTFNARSETVHEKPSFRDSWKAGRHCIIPCEAFYEPDWRTGKAIPTRISAADGEPLGIAGLWAWWRPAGAHEDVYSFTMLTMNAADHPIMQNMHKPDDEKRMVVILNPDSYYAWLKAPADASRDFLHLYPAENLIAEPRPTPPRKAKEISNG